MVPDQVALHGLDPHVASAVDEVVRDMCATSPAARPSLRVVLTKLRPEARGTAPRPDVPDRSSQPPHTS